jgi:hypothetical protein
MTGGRRRVDSSPQGHGVAEVGTGSRTSCGRRGRSGRSTPACNGMDTGANALVEEKSTGYLRPLPVRPRRLVYFERRLRPDARDRTPIGVRDRRERGAVAQSSWLAVAALSRCPTEPTCATTTVWRGLLRPPWTFSAIGCGNSMPRSRRTGTVGGRRSRSSRTWPGYAYRDVHRQLQ